MNSWIDAPSEDANILLFRYEELTGKQNIESFKRLCTHCDIKIPDNLICQILSDYSFEKLSQGRQQGDENHNSHYRKGLPGDWKNHFTHKVRQHFEEVTGNLIDRLGYAWDDSSSLLDRERNSVDVASKITSVALPEKSLIPIEQILKLSHEHFVKNQLPDALDNYQKSIAILEAKLAESYFYMGSIYLKSNHIDLAIEFYKKSIDLNPNLADSYFYLGNLYRIKNEIDLAKCTYQKCLEINPELADAHFYLGSIYFSENKLDQAENHYNMCLKINSNLADAYFYLGEICIKKLKLIEVFSIIKNTRNSEILKAIIFL